MELTTNQKQYNPSDMQADMPARSIVAYISTDRVDSDGEIVGPEGIDVSRFKKNASVFWNHDYARPCGTCDKMKNDKHGLIARTVFPKRPTDCQDVEWLPDLAWGLMSCDPPIVKTFSIGFEYVQTRPANEKDYERYGTRQIGQVVSKCKLLEYSVAPLAANEDALVLAVRKGLLTDRQADWALGRQTTRHIRLPSTARRKIVKVQVSSEDLAQFEIDRARGRVFS